MLPNLEALQEKLKQRHGESPQPTSEEQPQTATVNSPQTGEVQPAQPTAPVEHVVSQEVLEKAAKEVPAGPTQRVPENPVPLATVAEPTAEDHLPVDTTRMDHTIAADTVAKEHVVGAPKPEVQEGEILHPDGPTDDSSTWLHLHEKEVRSRVAALKGEPDFAEQELKAA